MQKDSLRIASPCNLDWKKMTPAEGGRFCADCKKVVRNLSGMTEAEAKTLLHANGNAELCVRYLYDRDGRIVFTDRALVPASLLDRAKRVALLAPLAIAACSSPALNHEGTTSTSTTPTTQAPEGDDDSDYQQNMGGAPYYAPDAETTEAPDASADADAATDPAPPDSAVTIAPDAGDDADPDAIAPDGGTDHPI